MSTSSPPLVVHSHGQRYVPIWASSHEAKDFVTLMRARLRDLAQLQTMRRPTKRTSLAVLTRARLYELGQGFELDVLGMP